MGEGEAVKRIGAATMVPLPYFVSLRQKSFDVRMTSLKFDRYFKISMTNTFE
jgi:hypothetical protein